MKNISYEDLKKYIAKEYSKYNDLDFEISENAIENLIINANEEYYNNSFYECHIELSKTGKVPNIIYFYIKYIYDNRDNIINIEYYI